ncbi:hypothetical protein NGM33_28410 [Nocardiopsis dassonvillei]|uniref:hypothetical protein n=1 Tax=Nocardiopsis dassonvillei TaxID=2014 RepID=UPI0020A35072|nr:hypothetical protein [Nocardiopsis dassonvillei]MCP3017259.1 hypothetical protein [Nocardiopsis dassonvillei]
MDEMSLGRMGFRDFIDYHRRTLDRLAACYESGIVGDGHLEELTELFDDAGYSLVLARSKATADLRDIEVASEGSMVPEDVDGLPAELVAVLTGGADLWEIAEADDDPVGSDADPRMGAFCQRKITAADEGLLGIFGATAELSDRDDYRDQHPFPIDPDEEAQW